MVDAFESGAVVTHVVGRPTESERVAAGDQLADQIGEPFVAGILAGVGAHGGDQIVGVVVPVGEEVPGGRAQEHEPGRVAAAVGVVEDGRVQRAPERIGRDDVHPTVAHPDGDADRVQEALQAGPHVTVLSGTTPSGRIRIGRAGEIMQVVGLGLVEPQCPGNAVENLRRDAAQIAPLHLGVVVDAHVGERGHLLATQTRHPAASTADDARLLRGHLVAPAAQEVGDLVTLIHALHASPGFAGLGCTGSTGITAPFLTRVASGAMEGTGGTEHEQADAQATARRRRSQCYRCCGRLLWNRRKRHDRRTGSVQLVTDEFIGIGFTGCGPRPARLLQPSR